MSGGDGKYGIEIGRRNQERVRDFMASHIGARGVECSQALGLSPAAVSRAIQKIRSEWANG